jgi:hypothetical protein
MRLACEYPCRHRQISRWSARLYAAMPWRKCRQVNERRGTGFISKGCGCNIAITPTTPGSLHSKKRKKGHGICPSISGPLNASLIKSMFLTQRRGQDYVLNGVVQCDFCLASALWQFAALIGARRPDLGEEVPVAIAMEYQFGFL